MINRLLAYRGRRLLHWLRNGASHVLARRFVWVVLAGILLVLAALGLPTPSTLITMDAVVETVDVEIANPIGGSFRLTSAYDEAAGSCRENLTIEPQLDSIVSYTRISNGPLYVAIVGDHIVEAEAASIARRSSLSRFIVNDPSFACADVESVRLPLNGALTVGQEGVFGANSEAPLLLSGHVTVFNRSIGSLYGAVPLDWGPFTANALYLADEIPLPPGSRLQGAKSPDGLAAHWWGFADVRTLSGGVGIEIHGSSNANSVDLFASAPSVRFSSESAVDGEPDVISMSWGSRLVSDPNLKWLYGIFGGLAAVGTLLSISNGQRNSSTAPGRPSAMKLLKKKHGVRARRTPRKSSAPSKAPRVRKQASTKR